MSRARCRHIFLADDDSDDQDFFVEAIEKIDKSINIIIADDGVSALDLLKADIIRPDLIVLDMNMPLLTGEQLLVELKKIKALKNIPVVLYSTSLSQEQVVELKKIGADYSFVKPVRFSKLCNELKTILKSEFESYEDGK